jgi:alanine-glyoxylate transaminase/serine-glyoxylate transaminase/serine-pyruvate transaminase
MARPTVGHLDPTFIELMEEIKLLLQYAFQTTNALTIPISAPASAAMECCFVNLVEPGEKVIVCRNGVFGERMKENVERCGGIAIIVDYEWGTAVDPNKLEDTLKANPDAKIVAFVHAETSTGVLSDAKILCEIAQQYDCLTIVDALTSLGGNPLKVDEWQMDAVYSGSQKCLSAPPGLSPITFSPRAVEKVQGRKTKVQSWFFDLNLIMAYWGDGKRVYHHTAPVNALYGLHESLLMLKEEGLEKAWTRHERNYRALRSGFEAMGLSYNVVRESERLPQLNAINVLEGIDDAEVRQRLLNEHWIEIGSGLGNFYGKIWRIGLMGYSSHMKNVLDCLRALEEILKDMGANISEENIVSFLKDGAR